MYASRTLLRTACRGINLRGPAVVRNYAATAARLDGKWDEKKWSEQFLAELATVPNATDPAQSSAALRTLCKSGLLKFTDMSEHPEKFFLAHRLLSSVGLGGFGIRFTVQFNLFAGSIVGLAGPEQIKMLDVIQEKGQLGCFLLTEKQAGVLSGLIVETTATYDEEKDEFVLNTPRDAAAKNWISQGYTAELGVVIADLVIKGKSHGPHPFFLQMRDDKQDLLPGIRVEDMGFKTVANDLDNARVWFDSVRLPKSSLLNRFCDVKDGEYVQVGEERMRIEVIGQRLMTGRQAIAEAALLSCKVLHKKTEEYAKNKICNAINGETTLASMPQLKHVFDESYRQLDECIGFVAAVENELNVHLKAGTIPPESLIDKIAVCKIRAISVSIERAHVLRLEVGSYALMHDTGFELMDMLLCCKFAEGDSRILQMKLMRDRLKKVKKMGVPAAMMAAITDPEARAALLLANKLNVGRDLDKMQEAMVENWAEIYELAEMIEERIIRETPGATFIEGDVVDRLKAADNKYDTNWLAKIGSGGK